jgi:hypothetical protein
MWTCPKCGRSFTRPHQSHSCGRFSVEAILEGKTSHEVALYRRFEELALGVGEVVVAPAKTRIGFQRGRIFAAVNGVNRGQIQVHIVTEKPIRSGRIHRVEALAPDCYVNHARFANLQEMDEEVVQWLRRGYEWGGASLPAK